MQEGNEIDTGGSWVTCGSELRRLVTWGVNLRFIAQEIDTVGHAKTWVLTPVGIEAN